MSQIEQILDFNKKFVEDQAYKSYVTDKYPNKKLVIVTCMDTRLVELLPKAMNLKNGDAKVLKTAGALISHPYGSVMRSILVAVTLLKAEEVYVVGHLDCGMIGLHSTPVLEALESRGVSKDKVESLKQSGVDIDRWLTGCRKVEEGVMESVELIKNHPLFPDDALVHGLTIHPTTGELQVVHDGRIK